MRTSGSVAGTGVGAISHFRGGGASIERKRNEKRVEIVERRIGIGNTGEFRAREIGENRRTGNRSGTGSNAATWVDGSHVVVVVAR